MSRIWTACRPCSQAAGLTPEGSSVVPRIVGRWQGARTGEHGFTDAEVSSVLSRLRLLAFTLAVASGCTRRIAVVHVPPAPRAGHVAEDQLASIRIGMTVGDLRTSSGDPLDVEPDGRGEIWRYRVYPKIRCTIITKRFLGRTTTRTDPSEDSYALVSIRDGVVDAITLKRAPLEATPR
jgi:hypothetical protein